MIKRREKKLLVNRNSKFRRNYLEVDEAPNLALIKCFALLWFSIYMAIFLRGDLENIKRRTATKGLTYVSVAFMIVAWL